MVPPTTESENLKEVSIITATIIGVLGGLIILIMIYTYFPIPGFIHRFVIWWYFRHHAPPPTGGQQQNPTTNLPAQNNDNDSNDGTQDPPINNNANNNNNNNNNNTIELTDFNTGITPSNTTQN